jgi:protein-S-isoprenylcysteine O-methyltransferase Ste14
MNTVSTFLLVILAGYACLPCFGFRHGRGGGLQYTLVISILVALALYAYHIAEVKPPLSGIQYTGVCGLMLSIGLLVWAIRSHRGRPGAAFAGHLPVALIRHGPYRLERHPIYTSYLVPKEACPPRLGDRGV